MRTLTLWSGIAVVLTCGIVLWNTDWFHRTTFPKRYWTEQVKKHEDLVSFYTREVQSCRLELERLRRTRDIDLKQRQLSGMPPQEAVADVREEREISLDICRMYREFLDNTTRELEYARRELAKDQD